MAISPVSSTSNAVSATQAVKPDLAPEEVQRIAKANKASEDRTNAPPPQAPPAAPSVNNLGQSIGTLINVTA
jgi:hypothetical protein